MSENMTQQTETRTRARRADAFLAVIVDSLTSMFNNNPGQAAASIAYYFLFSVFPLFLFVVIIFIVFINI